MKSKTNILIFSMFVLFSKLNAQYMSFTVIPASCSSCCDGSFTVEVTYCVHTIIIATTPTLSLTSYSSIPGRNTYHNVCPNTYSFYTANTDLCSSVTQTYTIPFATNILGNQKETDELKVFPNPISNKLYFGLNKYDYKFDLSIFSAYGECVIQNSNADLNQSLDVSFLKAGVYFVKIQNQSSQKTIKVIKE